jgi:type IV pilus assembly protein PilQ
LTVATAGAFVNASSSADGPAAVSSARLKTISSRVSSKGASLVIEASDPVGYVATYPDPLTVVLDFRNVLADGGADSLVGSAKNSLASLNVEPAELVGAPASRVRVTLGQPMGHHVRAERNTVVIDFDKDAHAAPYVLPPTHNAAAPDAMSAVRGAGAPGLEIDAQTARAADPIEALGLDKKPTVSAPQAAPYAAVRPLTTQPAAVAALQSTLQTGTPTKYSGTPLSLDLQGADLRAVLRTFSEISGLNMVIDPTVNGTVDVALHDVPWDQAMAIILTANKLGYTVDGTILRIAPLDTGRRADAAQAR